MGSTKSSSNHLPRFFLKGLSLFQVFSMGSLWRREINPMCWRNIPSGEFGITEADHWEKCDTVSPPVQPHVALLHAPNISAHRKRGRGVSCSAFLVCVVFAVWRVDTVGVEFSRGSDPNCLLRTENKSPPLAWLCTPTNTKSSV